MKRASDESCDEVNSAPLIMSKKKKKRVEEEGNSKELFSTTLSSLLLNEILPWETLTAEILHHIFSFLDFKDLERVLLVCKYWNEIVNMVHSLLFYITS